MHKPVVQLRACRSAVLREDVLGAALIGFGSMAILAGSVELAHWLLRKRWPDATRKTAVLVALLAWFALAPIAALIDGTIQL